MPFYFDDSRQIRENFWDGVSVVGKCISFNFYI